MKILLLSDGLGWIVDRLSNKMKELIPQDIEVDYYTTITPDDFVKKANSVDIVHFNNWDVIRQLQLIPQIKSKVLISVRSFRYPDYVKELQKFFDVHVINPKQLEVFPNATYIPDPIFDQFFTKRKFKVGMAFDDNSYNREYKGYNLVKKVCDDLGIEVVLAKGIKPEDMPKWYKSIDLYVCASINEGQSTPVMECLALNKPVVTTDVGIPSLLNVHKAERTFESLKQEIGKFYTSPQVEPYKWDYVASKFNELYERILEDD
jgi:glycosyltransferase involved in cell wall biosynthesis